MSDEQGLQSLALWEEGLEPSERARRMIATKKLISGLMSEKDRRDYDLFNLRLYSKNNDLMLYDLFNQGFVDSGRGVIAPTENSKNNRAKAAIDTLASQVASTDTRARCEVIDGDYRVRRRARKLQAFDDGLADELKLARVKRRMFMDSAVFESGVGVQLGYRNGNRVAFDRVLPTELAIDPSDGFVNGQARTIYRERPMPLANILRDFGGTPELDEKIRAAKQVHTGGTPIDQRLVYESWTLPTEEGAGDGWHIIAVDIDGGDLVVEQYERMIHCLVFFAIEERFTGTWGNSLMTQARDLQIRINANDFRIERSTKVFHAQHLYTYTGQQLKKSKLSNEIGTVWEGATPDPPKQITFTSAAPELYQQIERDGQRIFEDLGVNLQASQGVSEAGLDASGEARREARKTLDERNSIRQQNYEDLHLDLIRVANMIAKEIADEPDDEAEDGKKKRGYPVVAKLGKYYQRIDWKDVAIDEANYKLMKKPASPVPTDPEGLLARGQDLVDMGLWTPDRLAEAWGDLDIDGRIDATVAKRRNLERKIDEALYEGAALMPPDEFTDYKLAMEVGLELLNQAEEDGVPQKSVEKVRRYLRQVNRANNATNAPPPPAAAPAPPSPAPQAAAS
ncbi:MAG TPA: hypothetical protein VFY10_11405 [Dehalococcoidia bacterium]|nr:hypothetical protein [Dehalococcoidia bacterium]